VITVSNDLVFNCLVDNGKIDQLALMENKAESEQKLLVQENGRSSIRGGNIREVHILPNGDFWQVYNHSVSMTSNRKRLRQLIGVDRTAAIRETENEIEQLSNEVNDLTAKAQSLKRERHQYKVRWNKLKKEDEKARFEMQRLEDSIETIREEAAAAENVTIDTREYEDDVKEAEKACEELKEKEEETRNAIEALKAPIREMEAKVEETKARSKKVSNDLNNASEKLKEYIRHVQQRDRVLDKKRDKVTKWEELRQTHLEIIASRTEKCAEGLQKAQMIQYQIKETQEKRHKNSSGEGSDEGTEHQNVKTQEEIDNEIRSIQPIQTNKEPNHWQQKIERAEKEIERERQRRRITEVDPEVALNKYQRARKDLENKIRQLQIIENNENNLVNDLRDRKMRWKDFQSK
jgi:chromosome segregation ATPase